MGKLSNDRYQLEQRAKRHRQCRSTDWLPWRLVSGFEIGFWVCS